MPLLKSTNNNLIDSDIYHAQTLPTHFYRDEACHNAIKEKIFAGSWQLIADTDKLLVPGAVLPVTLLPGCLDEPLLLTRDHHDNLSCLANVCTHRGNLLVEGQCHIKQLRCRYHGRCFNLNGDFVSTPGFEQALDFPSSADNLAQVSFVQWEKFVFASLNPLFPFADLLGQMQERLSWLPLKNFVLDPNRSRDYVVKANWALYVENYLEGFHIPYVHPTLATALDTKNYRTEIYRLSNLQIGQAANPADSFCLPPTTPDYGLNIGAYYFWLFPNTMLNFYPWGLSVNIVIPLALDRTKISYLTYIFDESKIEQGAGANTDKTEREDENIVEQVQKGMQSRLYKRGRYSPEWERGTHHFHRLLTEFLAEDQF